MTTGGQHTSEGDAPTGTALDTPWQAWLKQVGLKTSDLLIALPVIHLGLTISYMFAYGAVYGGGLRNILSASDIANTAVRQMPIVYAICIIAPMLSFSTSVNNLSSLTRPATKRASIITLILLEFISGGVLIYGVYLSRKGMGNPFDTFFALPFSIISTGSIAVLIAYRLKLSARASLLLSLIFIFQTVSAYQGAQVAQLDKYADFGDPNHPRPVCGDSEVLGTISDRYLVVRRDGSKALYTLDCKINITLPTPRWLSNAKPTR